MSGSCDDASRHGPANPQSDSGSAPHHGADARPPPPRATADAITASLQAVADDTLAPGERLERLESLQTGLQTLRASVSVNRSTERLPDFASDEAVVVLNQLERRMAIEYQRLAPEQPAPDTARPAAPDVLPIARALDHWGHVLLRAYRGYSEPPAGTWRQLHDLYGMAERASLQHEPVPEPGVTGNDTAPDIETRYKRLLLVAIAFPFAMPADEISRWETAARDLAPLLDIGPPLSNDALFIVDPRRDSPPLPRDLFGTAEPGSSVRTIDTRRVSGALRNQLQFPHGPGGALLAPGSVRRLLRILDSPPHRHFPRIHRVTRIRMLPSLLVPAPDSTGRRTAILCESGDVSAGGYRLQWQAHTGDLPRVGEIVGLGPDAGPEPASGKAVGVVRWVRNDGVGWHSAGVQLLASRYRPARIRSVDRAIGGGRPHPAILLPAVKSIGRGETVLLPDLPLKAGDPVEIDVDGVWLAARVEQRLEAACGFMHHALQWTTGDAPPG